MITLEKAKKALIASENKAKELNIFVTTVVVDRYGVIIAMSRMDDAIVISPKFAVAKAFTSASLGLPSKDIAQFAVEGKPYFGLTNLSGGELATMAGGVPVVVDGQLVGGIGVGGSQDTEQDEACAKAALQALL